MGIPKLFGKSRVGHTLVNRTAGLKVNEEQSHIKIKFMCEDVQGNRVVTNFHGMGLTRDKICSLVKKWHTLIEAWVDVKTTDGYVLRMFVMGFTKRRRAQICK